MSRTTGNILPVGDVVEKPYPTTLKPDSPSSQYVIPPVLPNVKSRFTTGVSDIKQSDPYNLQPLYFNQTGNTIAELFEAPVENFNMKLKPTQTSETPISRASLSASQVQSRYSSLAPE